MKAIRLHAKGEPEAVLQYEDIPDPTPDAGEVVVRLRAAALNHRDLFICRGQYANIHIPLTPGSDGVGEVAALGTDVRDVKVGDAVIINPSLDWGDDPATQGPQWRILGLPDDGTFAEYVKVPASSILPRPNGLTDEEAATLPLTGLTAYRAVVTKARTQPGETVLVTGIGGGVATFALLIARHIGARVVVTSGSDEKIARARALGAEDGWNYTSADWTDAIRSVTDGYGPDVIIDGTGGAIFNQALDVARPGGRVVTYGATLGAVAEMAVRRIFWKQLQVLGTTMGSPDDFREMLSLFAGDKLHPVVDKTFALAETAAALRHMSEAAQFGKIALRITQ